MFLNATSFSGYGLEKWDISKSSRMQYMFAYATKFDANLSEWDVSFMDNTCGMFVNATSFSGVDWYNQSSENQSQNQTKFVMYTVPARQSISCHNEAHLSQCYAPNECFMSETDMDTLCYALPKLFDCFYEIDHCPFVPFTDYVNWNIVSGSDLLTYQYDETTVCQSFVYGANGNLTLTFPYECHVNCTHDCTCTNCTMDMIPNEVIDIDTEHNINENNMCQ
jgi:Mycoplasma protein of unknown function, DUF285